MPKSKTDKTRKEQKEKFKTKIKKQMSEQKLEQELQSIPEIKQYPVWKSSEKIEVAGIEWEAIYNILNMFKQAIVAGEAVMNRGLQSGKITMKYVDAAGNDVSPAQVEEYSKRLQELFAKNNAKSEPLPDLNEGTIVDVNGQALTGEDITPTSDPSSVLKSV